MNRRIGLFTFWPKHGHDGASAEYCPAECAGQPEPSRLLEPSAGCLPGIGASAYSSLNSVLLWRSRLQSCHVCLEPENHPMSYHGPEIELGGEEPVLGQ